MRSYHSTLTLLGGASLSEQAMQLAIGMARRSGAHKYPPAGRRLYPGIACVLPRNERTA